MKLSEARKLRNLTQEEVARRADISLSTYVKMESGRIQPKVKTALRVAFVLQFSPYDLFNDENFPEQPRRKKGA